MNYRHAFHAGNHADILKHVVLTRILDYLKRKAKPIRVIDTHAGIGLYDLGASEAVRSPEWREGIGRLDGAPLTAEAEALLAPFRAAVAAVNAGRLLHYPGSPLIVQQMLRADDALEAIELHPVDHGLLVDALGRDGRIKVLHLDGWLALGAHLPPKERRGLVLVDPPFEEAADWGRLVDGLKAAHRRFANGVYLLWYPLKAGAPVDILHRDLRAVGIPRILAAEMSVRDAGAAGLSGSGVIVVNPPFTLEAELGVLLPALTARLAQDGGASWRIRSLGGEA
ncbi:23S rRNA (adenine(2030)-N(6))-methyltransferase RlmJ [Acuticoccus sp. I52.16.1]|uniref:23S rRNA (adenine(2030)-N(6))-methyltransferase RlmJ n=1 Tax=Acuticoccus sp. I52.16.1 TaxID=2928472 RepID=UPI001FD1AA2A|nr:23S rRNA (adenine(2030)-N(6))-methyltransferase RlmJ [Acuticoccus sp. I52.16.1]UOM36805.1 23S rRNA (adenine(2030)-N(6))-methyltransferase RlmJ [Acuticoccus sp. I52.16.1]